MIYALDNGQSYSGHCIHFVDADPELWGPSVEDFLLWPLRSRCYDPDGVPRVLLVAGSVDWREPEAVATVERFIEPRDCIEWSGSYGGQVSVCKPSRGSECIGRRRADLLVARWHKITDIHQGWDGETQLLGKPIFLADFERLLSEGAFQ